MDRARDGRWRDVSPGFITAIFFTLRVRYQYYHNFTFVIGWHRASVTCSLFFFFLRLSLFLLDFQSFFSLYFFHRFVLFSFFSLYYFLLVPSFFFLSSITTPYYSLFFLYRHRFRGPRSTHCSLVFGLCSWPPAIVPRTIVAFSGVQWRSATAKIRETDA